MLAVLGALWVLVATTMLTTGMMYKALMPAFPGAEGFGAHTPGGRGGKVLIVDRLDDYPAGAEPIMGTLRWALETNVDQQNKRVDRRIIVFRVGGVIEALHPFVLAKPFVTLAGQTAPGDGITIKHDALVIATHDVIVRGMRLRVGDARQQQRTGATPDGINITTQDSKDDVRNVIIDHCSVSWALDENGSVWNTRKNSHALRNVTVQWSIVSEGLRDRERRTSMGLIVGDKARNISIHHNLFAHNNDRNPAILADVTAEIVNNVIYNWRDGATTIKDSNHLNRPSNVNLIGNFYKPGPNYRNDTERADYKGIHVASSFDAQSRIYVRGNVGPGRPDDDGDDWNAVSGNADRYRSHEPAVDPGKLPVTVDAATTAYDAVLLHAGATAPQRDAVDARIVDEVRDGGAGKIIDLPSERGGFPAYVHSSNGLPAEDADADGMPDAFELANTAGGSATRLSPQQKATSGYTWIEEYVNSLIVGPNVAHRP